MMSVEQGVEIIKLLHSLDHTGYIVIGLLAALFGMIMAMQLFRK